MEQIENRTLDELKFGDTPSLAHTLTYKRAQLHEKGCGYRILIEGTRGLSPIHTAGANAAGPRITTAGSRVSAWVIPTDEDLMIARHAVKLLAANKTFSPSMETNITFV